MPRHSRSVYRRRRLAVFGSTGVLLALVSGLAVVGFAPLPQSSVVALAATDLTSPEATLALPSFGTTALAADGFGILSGDDLDTPRPIASIAKVVTALVVLEARPISGNESGEFITFDASDVDRYASALANAESRAEVQEGIAVSQRDVITVMLVESANNYAWTLVRWAFGSEEQFLEAASAWCARNGLTATTLRDSSGLDSATQSSPRDLLAIGRLAMANPVIAGAVGTATAAIPPAGNLENTNKLLGIGGVNGIKTGTTDEAGACLLYSVAVPVGDEFINLVGVTLGAPTHTELNEALLPLIASVEAGFHVITLAAPGVPLATATSAWQTITSLSPTQALQRIVWSSTPVLISLPTEVLATGDARAQVGSATFRIGDEEVVIGLMRDTEVPDPGLAWRISHLDQLVAVP